MEKIDKLDYSRAPFTLKVFHSERWDLRYHPGTGAPHLWCLSEAQVHELLTMLAEALGDHNRRALNLLEFGCERNDEPPVAEADTEPVPDPPAFAPPSHAHLDDMRRIVFEHLLPIVVGTIRDVDAECTCGAREP